MRMLRNPMCMTSLSEKVLWLAQSYSFMWLLLIAFLYMSVLPVRPLKRVRCEVKEPSRRSPAGLKRKADTRAA